MFRLCCFGVALLMFGLASPATAEDIRFTGKWVGSFKNSLGDKGKSVLQLKEEDGKFTGTWDDATVTSGKRVNKNTIQLEAKNSEHSYQITATVENGEMKMKYQATHKKKGAYNGTATLEHKKK